MGISFQVDSTKAEITSITGLEDDIINAESVTVKYVVYDTMGIKSIQIIVNGTLLEEITDFSADYNNYTGQFVLLESKSAQKVQIVVTDLAGNVTDTANEFTSAYTFYDEVTVSTNIFVRWYADKALFWGSIGGAVVLLGGIWLAIALILKKKQGN